MKSRCHNSKVEYYPRYGGRGIKVCERWLKYSNFNEDLRKSYELHVKKYGSINTTLDRVNNEGDYTPKNCRWATQKEQANNRKAPREFLITIKGITKNTKYWAEHFGVVRRQTANQRIRLYNWNPIDAVITPPHCKRGQSLLTNKMMLY